MKKNRNKLPGQILILLILLIVCLVSSSMIYLGSTVFRSQLPLFQLIDGEKGTEITLGPEPASNPGVIDLEVPNNINLFMLLGSDFRPESGFRTDTIVLVALDKQSGKLSLVSFPRDLWVSIPGFGEERINTVMQLGGFSLLAETMQTNFGVYPTHYAIVEMEGFIKIIDEMGGVEFTTDHMTADACDSSMDPDGWCEVGPGEINLDSTWALWYVRARYNSSDFERLNRTQEVINAVVNDIASPKGLWKLPGLLRIYRSDIESNITPNQLMPMLKTLIGFDSTTDIRRYSIGPNEATGWTTDQGASILLPNTPAIQTILQEALTFE